MPHSYSIQAGFENLESPELIAASLYILQNEGWTITDFNDTFISAEKKTVGNQMAGLGISVSNHEINIECKSELEEKALQFIVDSFAETLHRFVSSPSFDHKVIELKHHYFMSNPIVIAEDSSSEPEPSFVNSMFSFRKSFRVTPAIVLINFLVFVVMIISGVSFISPKTIDIINWGGNFRPYILQGEWWRLITCCFIHIGIIHILFNMWALYSIGSFLERMIGSWRFAFAYLIAGLAGSLNSIVWHYATPSAGASGAIFGMFGLFLALLTTNLLEKGFRKDMLKSVLLMIFINLFIGTSAQIDNAGHIGGLIAGLICGYLYAWHYKNPRSKVINALSFIAPLILIAVSSIVIAQKLPDPYSEYEVIIKKFATLESKAIKLQTKDVTPANLDTSTKLWNEAIIELKKADELGLNKDINFRNSQILFYLEKRKQEVFLLRNAEANTELLKRNNQSIDSVLTLLNHKEE